MIDDADLDWYDYGFRSYDPQIGRFPQLDPLTNKYPNYTPYQFAGNEPIANVDMDGKEPATAINLANNLSKDGINASMHVIQSGANMGKWVVGWVSSAGIGHSVMFAAKAVGQTGLKIGAGTATSILTTITKSILASAQSPKSSTDHMRVDIPNKAMVPVAKQKQDGGWQIVVYGSGDGGSDIGSQYNPNKTTLYVDFPKFMNIIELGGAGMNAANAIEDLSEGATSEKAIELIKKATDAKIEEMGKPKNSDETFYEDDMTGKDSKGGFSAPPDFPKTKNGNDSTLDFKPTQKAWNNSFFSAFYLNYQIKK